MELLLTHWHCIVPLIAIALVLLLQNKAKENTITYARPRRGGADNENA
jgi:hypothetical protein